MREVAVLIDRKGNPIYWHVPDSAHASSVEIQDDPKLWDAIWTNRDNLMGIAHSHPGRGIPAPGGADAVAYNAIETALDRLDKRLVWWVCSLDGLVLAGWCGPGKYDYRTYVVKSASWLPRLRILTDYGMPVPERPARV